MFGTKVHHPTASTIRYYDLPAPLMSGGATHDGWGHRQHDVRGAPIGGSAALQRNAATMHQQQCHDYGEPYSHQHHQSHGSHEGHYYANMASEQREYYYEDQHAQLSYQFRQHARCNESASGAPGGFFSDGSVHYYDDVHGSVDVYDGRSYGNRAGTTHVNGAVVYAEDGMMYHGHDTDYYHNDGFSTAATANAVTINGCRYYGPPNAMTTEAQQQQQQQQMNEHMARHCDDSDMSNGYTICPPYGRGLRRQHGGGNNCGVRSVAESEARWTKNPPEPRGTAPIPATTVVITTIEDCVRAVTEILQGQAEAARSQRLRDGTAAGASSSSGAGMPNGSEETAGATGQHGSGESSADSLASTPSCGSSPTSRSPPSSSVGPCPTTPSLGTSPVSATSLPPAASAPATSNQRQQILSQVVAVDVEGVALGSDYGTISIVTIASSRIIYLFDVTAMGPTCFHAGRLGQVLSSTSLVKLMYDCRADAAALYHQFGVRLACVCDLQVMASMTIDPASSYLIGMERAFTQLGFFGPEEVAAKSRGTCAFAPERGGDPHIWEQRPLPALLVEYCGVDVKYFFKAYWLMVGNSRRGLEVGRVRVEQSCEKGQFVEGGQNRFKDF